MRQPTAASVRALSAFLILAAGSSLASAAAIECDGLYQDLQAGFLFAPGLLTVNAASNGSHSSFGQVQRLIPTAGVADFSSGFTGGVDPAHFSTTFLVTNITSTSATATGSFSAVDFDGDEISAVAAGTIAIASGSSTFTGTLSGIVFSDNGLLDDQFDGGSGSFSLSGFSALTTGSFTVFASNIDVSLSSDQSNFLIEPSYASFEISAVPSPSAAAAFVTFSAVSLRRRRR